jgi:hypothetical protein
MKSSPFFVLFVLLACLITQASCAYTIWQQDYVLTASDKAASDDLGNSVSTSDNIALVGAISHDTGGLSNAGAAYLYVSSNGGVTWPATETVILTASDKAANDLFGFSVSASNNSALIGAPYHDTGALAGAGAAYLYRSNNGGVTWPSSETQLLTASDKAASDGFGFSVSISGDVALLGAPSHDTGGLSNAGAAYLYVSSNGGVTWPSSETQKITASDKAASDSFGYSVSTSGNIALVGAISHDTGGLSNAGAAYLYVSSNGGVTWPATETVILTASDKAASDSFGRSVSISGNIALIGAPDHDTGGLSNAGAAYLYVSNNGGVTWPSSETQKLTASDKAASDSFGRSVSISGNIALIGAPDHDTGGLSNAGAAYLFQSIYDGVTWPSSETQKLTASENAVEDYFGTSVSVSGNVGLIGSGSYDTGGVSDSGAAFIFEPIVPPSNPNSFVASDSAKFYVPCS